jgi:hypothetical protein
MLPIGTCEIKKPAMENRVEQLERSREERNRTVLAWSRMRIHAPGTSSREVAKVGARWRCFRQGPTPWARGRGRGAAGCRLRISVAVGIGGRVREQRGDFAGMGRRERGRCAEFFSNEAVDEALQAAD